MFERALVVVAAAGLSVPAAAFGGGAQDGFVDESALAHSPRLEVVPGVIEQGEGFEIRFRALSGDLTGAEVGIDSGGGVTWFDASVVGVEGPYDVWGASVPGVSAASFRYYIAAEDGGDRAYVSASGVGSSFPAGEGFLVDFQTMSHVPLGSTVLDDGVHFRVWAPGTAQAWVGGDFNAVGMGPNEYAFDTPMQKMGDYFYAFVPGDLTGTGYKFSFNGFSWKPDPRAAFLNENQDWEALIYERDSYSWSSDDFVAPAPESWVVYQLHVGTFAGRNDPQGFAPNPSRFIDVAFRADHLEELGVNAVYLNPMTEFPFSFSGGYNPITLFGTETSLGTPDQFKFMVDELHKRGIAVIVDTVWNHMDSFANFKWFYDGSQIYYDNPVVDTPWGPQLDFDEPEVADLIVESAEWMLGEFRLDGFRADAIFEIYGANQPVSGREILQEINAMQDRGYRDGFVVAEDYSDNPWVTSPGGLNFDGQYSNNYKEAIRAAVFSAGLGDPDIQRLADAIDGVGLVTGTRAFHYFELHDDAWPLNGRERAVRTIDTTFPHDDDFARDRTILGNGITLLSRGMPAILQGTEWLEDDGWEANKIDWQHKTDYAGVFNLYSDLIGLRTTEEALFADSFLAVIQANDGANVLAFERSSPDGVNFVIVANFSDTGFGSYDLGSPRDTAYEVVLNSEDPAYGGSGEGSFGFVTPDGPGMDGRPQSMTVGLPARGLLVLRTSPDTGPACPTDFDGSGETGLDDLLTVLGAFGQSGAGDTDGDGQTGLDDLLAVLGAFGSACP